MARLPRTLMPREKPNPGAAARSRHRAALALAAGRVGRAGPRVPAGTAGVGARARRGETGLPGAVARRGLGPQSRRAAHGTRLVDRLAGGRLGRLGAPRCWSCQRAMRQSAYSPWTATRAWMTASVLPASATGPAAKIGTVTRKMARLSRACQGWPAKSTASGGTMSATR